MSAGLVVVALGLGIFSAIIQVTMNWAQQRVADAGDGDLHREPVWAGILDALPENALPLLALVGAAFIVVGVLVSELKLKKT